MEALTGYQQVTAALEYHVEQILHAQPIASSLPPGVSYATTPVEQVQSHALQPPQIGSLAAMSELVIPQSEPWEPMSEFSDDPISLYAQSELDVCYANDPFTSTAVDRAVCRRRTPWSLSTRNGIIWKVNSTFWLMLSAACHGSTTH